MVFIRIILLIIGVTVALRFLGQLMIAKRNIEEQNRMKAEQNRLQKQKNYVEKNKGKTSLFSKNTRSAEPFEDVDYEEVNK